MKLPKGAPVFLEGDENTYLYNVVAGAVRLSKLLSDGRRQVTGFLFAGDCLGLSVADTYTYSAEALTELSLCRFRRAQLIALMESMPRLEHRMLELASNELVEAQAHMLVLGQKLAPERVSTVLRQLARRIGRRRAEGLVVDMPMTRADLAEYLGLSIETVSRCLSRLRADGVIGLPRAASVHVLREAELARRAGD